MDFNITNRVLVGFLLGLSIFLSYFFILDKYLLLLILLFITYDFYKIKVNIFFLFSLLLSFSILFFVIPYDNYKYLFLFEIFLIFCIFFNYKYKIEFFVISLFIFFLILFYIGSFDRDIFYTIIFISFFNDTLAYYIGKNIGGPAIVPKISPNKTWSGTLISFLITFLLLTYLKHNIILAVLISLFLFLGDVFFSYIKRYLNTKDFSSLFGKHGGLLDRLDSMFFVAIIYQINLVIFL